MSLQKAFPTINLESGVKNSTLRMKNENLGLLTLMVDK